MVRLRARHIVGFGAAVTLLSGCAGPFVPFPDRRCLAVSEISDGSWLVNRPLTFGRAVRVESGATLHAGEVLEGVDLGAVLQRECRDPSLNVPASVSRF